MVRQMPRSPVTDFTFERVDNGTFRLAEMTTDAAVLIFLRYVG